MQAIEFIMNVYSIVNKNRYAQKITSTINFRKKKQREFRPTAFWIDLRVNSDLKLKSIYIDLAFLSPFKLSVNTFTTY